MGIGKIFIGVAIIVIGSLIWFSMFSDMLDVFVDSPQARYDFREDLSQFQAIYFLIVIVAGIGLVLWGAQS